MSDNSTPKKERLQRRNEKIKAKWMKLRDKKYKGRVQLYSDKAILEMLADDFYISARTVEDIVFSRIKYR